jgi:hypothetical protein
VTVTSTNDRSGIPWQWLFAEKKARCSVAVNSLWNTLLERAINYAIVGAEAVLHRQSIPTT